MVDFLSKTLNHASCHRRFEITSEKPKKPLNEGQTIWRLAEVPLRISEIAFLHSLSFQFLIINFALQNKIESGPESLGSWSLPSISILEYPFKQFQVGRQRNGRMMSQQSAMF